MSTMGPTSPRRKGIYYRRRSPRSRQVRYVSVPELHTLGKLSAVLEEFAELRREDVGIADGIRFLRMTDEDVPRHLELDYVTVGTAPRGYYFPSNSVNTGVRWVFAAATRTAPQAVMMSCAKNETVPCQMALQDCPGHPTGRSGFPLVPYDGLSPWSRTAGQPG